MVGGIVAIRSPEGGQELHRDAGSTENRRYRKFYKEISRAANKMKNVSVEELMELLREELTPQVAGPTTTPCVRTVRPDDCPRPIMPPRTTTEVKPTSSFRSASAAVFVLYKIDDSIHRTAVTAAESVTDWGASGASLYPSMDAEMEEIRHFLTTRTTRRHLRLRMNRAESSFRQAREERSRAVSCKYSPDAT